VYLHLECDTCSTLPSVVVQHAANASAAIIESKMANFLGWSKLVCFCDHETQCGTHVQTEYVNETPINAH
jgi:hypothetical protein